MLSVVNPLFLPSAHACVAWAKPVRPVFQVSSFPLLFHFSPVLLFRPSFPSLSSSLLLEVSTLQFGPAPSPRQLANSILSPDHPVGLSPFISPSSSVLLFSSSFLLLALLPLDLSSAHSFHSFSHPEPSGGRLTFFLLYRFATTGVVGPSRSFTLQFACLSFLFEP